MLRDAKVEIHAPDPCINISPEIHGRRRPPADLAGIPTDRALAVRRRPRAAGRGGPLREPERTIPWLAGLQCDDGTHQKARSGWPSIESPAMGARPVRGSKLAYSKKHVRPVQAGGWYKYC